MGTCKQMRKRENQVMFSVFCGIIVLLILNIFTKHSDVAAYVEKDWWEIRDVYSKSATYIAARAFGNVCDDFYGIGYLIGGCISMLAIFQFLDLKTGRSGEFLHSLPITKKKLFWIKATTGIGHVTVITLIYTAGMLLYRASYMDELKMLCIRTGEKFHFGNDIAEYIKLALSIWLIWTIFYVIALFSQVVTTNIPWGIVVNVAIIIAIFQVTTWIERFADLSYTPYSGGEWSMFHSGANVMPVNGPNEIEVVWYESMGMKVAINIIVIIGLLTLSYVMYQKRELANQNKGICWLPVKILAYLTVGFVVAVCVMNFSAVQRMSTTSMYIVGAVFGLLSIGVLWSIVDRKKI